MFILTPLHVVPCIERQFGSSEGLQIIKEESRFVKPAPLAQEEEEDLEDAEARRPVIDRQDEQPKIAEAVEAEKDTDYEKKALPADHIDANSEKRKARVEAYLPLQQRPKSRSYKKPVNTASEQDDSSRDPRSANHKPSKTEPATTTPIEQVCLIELNKVEFARKFLKNSKE